ncbi:endo alpha-1,4 polygalactosaminidase [Streptacidiphilus sp. MAP5-3]|uniref:endo alpha-1,4 polygalactosaminidase n=1 Tax=unclassified Streptacidiphilus TaxID=2643834 RepID=UPI003516CE08
MTRREARLLQLVACCLCLLAGCSGAPTTSAPAPGPTRPTTAPPPPPPPVPVAGDSRWQPPPGFTWQWQLTAPVDTSVVADVYDIDAVDNSAQVVAALHAAGRKVVCYVNVGAWEPYRPDAARFPSSLLGKPLDGWPDERWLDVRRLDVLRPLIAQRLAVCKAKGFDAVEPDQLDGYTNDTGFPLTAADQLAFNRMVAGLAHARGLAVALKNDLDQIPQLLPDFDFAIDEQCAEYQECDELTPFVAAGKAVFEAEYNLPTSAFCPQARRLRFSAMLKHLALDAWRDPC